MNRATSPSKYADLQIDLADTHIDQALSRKHADRLKADLDSLIKAADPASQALANGIVDALGRLAAQVTLLQQNVEQTYRSRADRIRIDPLPFIPENRRTSPPPNAKHFEVEAAAAEFSGTGWHEPETNGIISWRWSGTEPNATVLLPTLGGRRLKLTLSLQMPFGGNFSNAPISVLVNDARLDLQPVGENSGRTDFTGEFELPDDEGFGTFTLVLQSGLYTDTDSSPQRDSRTLGVGLHKISLDRLAA